METIMWCFAAVAVAGALAAAASWAFPDEIDAIAALLGLDDEPEWRR